MQIVLRKKIKCMTGKLKCEGGNKGLPQKKSTKADEENKRLRGTKRCR